jgi:putative FmdB family regulatory protein
MPTYDFICPECNDIVEQFFHIYADKDLNCGHCGVPMKQKFSANPAIFKGEGWAGKTKK